MNAGIYPPSSQSVAAPLAIGGAAARPVQLPGGIDNSLDWRKTNWASMQDSVQSQARASNWRYGTVRTAATVTAVTTNYVGSVLGLGGLALACPFVATSALVFDSNNNRTYNVGSFGGSANFTGGVLMPDGRIFIAPRASTTARIVDLSTNTVTTPNCTFPGNQVYIASCLFDGGRKIYLAPYLNTTTAGVYDIQRQTLSVPAGTFSTVSGQGQVSSGALLLPDGRVFVAPLGSTACIYDPAADSLFTSARSLGSVSNFFGAVLLPSGDEIALIPQGATALVIYSWRRDTVRTIPGTATGHIGGQLAPDGTVFLIPGTSTVARVYDPVTDTLRNLPDTFSGSFHTAGAHGLPDGRLVMLPRSDASVFTYGTRGTPVDANIQLSPYFNHRLAMITYTDGSDREAVITGLSEASWTVSVYESFSDYRNCQTPTETRTFPGTPNRRAMLSAWPGWTPRVRDDGNWSLLPESTDDLPELPAVPTSVTARQIRLWLVRHGVSLAAVDAAIDAIPDAQQREECRVEWDWAPYVLRSHPLLVPLAAALGLSESQVDEAFREAATL